MKLVSNLQELKKGDSIIIINNAFFESLGFSKIFGDVFVIENGQNHFKIKCKETDAIEEVSFDSGTTFLLN